ncbi:ABC transporter substrate-binding protein [Streptomyces fulvorobeus]|uniref:Peptide/nickel transport system substrate-binding protein n=1 Tax=Streptomyces fulvorobeus TaxID=284028 RepID=A0A7J0C9B7_9ACTN|nr:ABC transporter substrate-binding protein [Streptomyces fulvorobeus]NYE42680.1 peptide/nickel transport system substrate-binding protein [Streptomyces fulvorobeus]GFM99089.1 solute-binding transport lipoprotein [Streptomyces fulvorobeus]
MNVRKRWTSALLGAGLAVALLSGCGLENGGNAAESDASIVVGMSDDVLTRDPGSGDVLPPDPASGYDPGSWLLFNNVFQSLISFPRGSSAPQPEAAESCEFENGNKTYRCTLRDGLTFSNGSSLTSKDVKYSFDRAIRINDPAGPAPLLSTISEITTPDERTVVFELTVPDATFPSKIASGAGSIVDHRTYPADRLRTDGQAIGSGPYELKSFDTSKAVFSVNSGYRGTADVRNSGVTLVFFQGNQKKLASALRDGDVDVAYRGLAASDIAELEDSTAAADKGIEVVEGSSAEVQHLVFNMKDPVAGKLPVRQAIAYLVDRDALVNDVYHSTATPLYSIIPAGITAHNTAFFDLYGGTPQPDKAEQVLRAAHITDKVKLTLWSTPSRYGPSTDPAFRAIAEQLNASGLFEAKVTSLPFAEYEKRVAAGELGVYVKGWVPDYPDPDNFTQPFFGTGNVLQNGYVNDDITGRIIPGTTALAERAATERAFDELQDLVAQDLPILPLWQGKQYAVAYENVSGLQWTLDASTVFRFWEISKF